MIDNELPLTTHSVLPSGGALAQVSVPMMVLAPGRFSTTKEGPFFSVRIWLSSRVTTSGAPPAPSGTMRRTGLVG
ncbi:hypothetical protein ACFJGX_04570 [Hydrogenophaga sp. UC242_50]|uniref:hypothetical protein n=1 Tax=Hydrogenophaga sp. UC242_50 TaxID=3350169 RepID=UPI0036D3D2B4